MKTDRKEKINGQKSNEDMAFRYLYGFGILFVVLSHCDGGGVRFLSNWMNFGAFHLAIFVFGSGYFFKKEKLQQPLSYFRQKIKRLLLPLWCWNLFYGILLALLKLCGFAFGEALTLKNLLLFPISSENLYVLNMGSWFIFPFFMVQLLYAVLKLLLDCLKKPQITDRLIPIIFIAAGGVGVYLAGHGYHEVKLYPVFRILYFMPFYACGMLYRDFLQKQIAKLPAFVVLGVCLFTSLLLNTYYGRTVYAIPSSCDYPFGVAATYLAAFLGIAFWMKVSEVLAQCGTDCKPLLTLGRSTWEIMIHQFAGIMAVKCFFAGANRLFGYFPDFDWNAFYGDIWYLYRPGGIEEYAFLYVLGAIGVPLFIRWLIPAIKTGICNGSGKESGSRK